MRLVDLFKQRQDDEELCLVRDLVLMYAADGKLADEEMELMAQIAYDSGIDLEKYKNKIKDLHSIKDAYPVTREKRLQHLLKVVSMMLADGECAKEEIKLCNLIASKMGFGEKEVGATVAFFVSNLTDMDKNMDIVLSYIANGGYYPNNK